LWIKWFSYKRKPTKLKPSPPQLFKGSSAFLNKGGEPRGAQGSPGEPRGAQGSPGEPRGAQGSPPYIYIYAGGRGRS